MTDPFDPSPATDSPFGTDHASGEPAEAAAPLAASEAIDAIEATAGAPANPPDPASPAGPTPHRRRSVGALQLAIATVALLAGAALFLSGFSLGARTATTPGTPAQEAELFAPFWDVYDSITKSYVGEVNRQKLVQGAIDGMIGALDDPYSSYMSPEELQRARESIGGEFSGIGAEVTTRPTDADVQACDTIGPACRLVVVAPIDGSPALRAGLKTGDVITAVDGRTVDGETLEEAIARIRGPKGTEVVLTIVRDDGVAVRDADRPRHDRLAPGGHAGPRGRQRHVRAPRRLLRQLGRPVRGRHPRRAREGRDPVHRGPARQPGRLRDGRPFDRQPVHRRTARSSGRRPPTGPRSPRTPRRAARRRVATSGSPSSSTAAAPRPARSSPAPSRTRSAARWSARRRSGRARSSSGWT